MIAAIVRERYSVHRNLVCRNSSGGVSRASASNLVWWFRVQLTSFRGKPLARRCVSCNATPGGFFLVFRRRLNVSTARIQAQSIGVMVVCFLSSNLCKLLVALWRDEESLRFPCVQSNATRNANKTSYRCHNRITAIRDSFVAMRRTTSRKLFRQQLLRASIALH